ncbi:MAG: AAA family ATPase [Candidatus Poribacteria bacterium]|nr:AAA family ATPase [Candidatus Poribacteria bacterium]
MRLRRLNLLRYGHFTNNSFELPTAKSDFHIVFGPNEAGKSTVLDAIEDLLFGIPIQSPYDFLHDYSSMRIGALLENTGESLEVVRRKGSKDTLLNLEGLPIVGGESVLTSYLAGADRSFFKRMFHLDHSRLQDGGRDILEARDDVGQMLFSAGTGIVGLRERLRKLRSEAEELWSPRHAKHRKFYIADDKLQKAIKELREQTVTASKWRELKRTYEKAQKTYSEVNNQIKEISAERNRLSRIRRVFSDVRRKQELDGQLGELYDVIRLPEDAATLVREAEQRDIEVGTRIATLQEQLERAEESLKELTFDETLIQRAEDVRQLYERRGAICSAKADLPKRQAELKAAEEELRINASELDWTETDSMVLIERIPSRNKVSVVRTLLSKRGQLDADVAGHSRVLREHQETYEALKQRLGDMDQPADVARLTQAIRILHRQGDLTSRVRSADEAHKSAQELVGRKLKVLNPSGIDEETLTNMIVPVRAAVQEYQAREQDWKRRLRETQQKASSAYQELDGAIATFKRIVRDEQVVTDEELKDARSRRDALWNLVKLKHVRGETILEDQRSGFEQELEDLAGAFEPALTKADDLADRRFEHAEATGRIAEIKRKIGEQEILLKQLQENEARLVEEGEQLEVKWTSMWAAAPFVPLAAEAMLEWLNTREKILESIEEREKTNNRLESLRDEERKAREELLGELAVLGIDIAPLAQDSLNMIIERATEEQRLCEAEADEKARLENDFDDVSKRVTHKEHDLRQAIEAQDDWQKKWIAALRELGLAKNTTLEAVSAQLDIIDQMRQTASHIRSLRFQRIDMINQAITDFEQVVRQLVEDVSEDLADQSAENAVLELESRLTKAEHVKELREEKNEEVERLSTQITGYQNERRELTGSISHLKTMATVETNEALKKAIQRSDLQRSLERERQEIINKFKRDGDGKSFEELVGECEGVVLDEVVAHEKSIQVELEDLQNHLNDKAEERSRAREAFQTVGGDDAAARAAANKQEALAEMQAVAERYVRVKTSSMLLQWAIDRYRREKQAPLLKRAGELFKIVTGGSFASLQVEFDDQDEAYLTGVRPSGSIVPMSGLSTGTADQLYLALRIAAIEDYLERADALPFIADDLFINFDNDRAAAGFRLLEELSQKTQVLFLTHHLHLVDLARSTFGDSVNLVNLTDQEAASAAHLQIT